MKKKSMLVKILVMVLAVFMVLSLSGCQQYMYHAWYKTDKTEFNINDVTLEFFYGVLKPDFIHSDTVLLFFSNRILEPNEPYEPLDFENNPNLFFIKEIKGEDFYTKDYEVNAIGYKQINANHSEMITIPKEAFNSESGTVFFYLYPSFDYWYICMHISYELNGNTVTLLLTENSVAF